MKKVNCFARTSVMVLMCAWLSGCVNWLPAKSRINDFQPKDEFLESRYFDVEIISHDGIKLRATVFQPALKPGETAPLLIHSHGFSVFRMSGPISMYGQLLYPGKAALNAWRNGYWVISFDHRGHGGSGGTIRVMHPDYEVRDVATVIDWAEKNINRLDYRNQDPVIGMIGESYGGSAAILGASIDDRIDAIIPVSTWHNLESSLYPNQVPKSGWLSLLIMTANSLNPGKVDPILNKAYAQAIVGDISNEIFEYLYDHHPKFVCDQGTPPQVDIFMIQGFRDVLFTLNEGEQNYQCMKNTGRDVRFVGTQGGHLLPMAQFSWVPAFSLEETIHCGDQTYNLEALALAWFDEKLRGIPHAADSVPKLCLTLDYHSGVSLSDIPKGGRTFDFKNVNVHTGLNGLFELVMKPVDAVTSLVTLQQSDEAAIKNRDGGILRPRFEPLYVASEDDFIAGIPLTTLTLDSSDPDNQPTVFIGIGVRRAGSSGVELLNDQVTPIKSVGTHTLEMPGISTQLHQGDTVGLLVQTYSNQYRLMNSGITTNASLSGSVAIPILHDTISEHASVPRDELMQLEEKVANYEHGL